MFGTLDGREDGVSDVPRAAAAAVMCCDSSERRHKVSVVIRKARSHQNHHQAARLRFPFPSHNPRQNPMDPSHNRDHQEWLHRLGSASPRMPDMHDIGLDHGRETWPSGRPRGVG